MATDKQIAANRENALKSTGPITPEGKARSSMNALKHGLSAETLVIPGEDAAELETFHDQVRQLCQPQDAIEESMVRQFVLADWRTRRFNRMESGTLWDAYNDCARNLAAFGFDRNHVKPETPAAKATFLLGRGGRVLAGDCGVLTSLSRYEASIRRSYVLSLQMILPMRARAMEGRQEALPAPAPTRGSTWDTGTNARRPVNSEIEPKSGITYIEPTG